MIVVDKAFMRLTVGFQEYDKSPKIESASLRYRIFYNLARDRKLILKLRFTQIEY